MCALHQAELPWQVSGERRDSPQLQAGDLVVSNILARRPAC
jgi:hypothetical protein